MKVFLTIEGKKQVIANVERIAVYEK